MSLCSLDILIKSTEHIKQIKICISQVVGKTGIFTLFQGQPCNVHVSLLFMDNLIEIITTVALCVITSYGLGGV